MDFDLQRPDGAWESFPSSVSDVSDDPSVLVCTMSGSRAQKLAPNDKHVEQIRLADPFLGLDTVLPPPNDGRIHPHHPGSEFLLSTGDHKIRLRLHLSACVFSRARKAEAIPVDPYDAKTYCAPDGEVHPDSPLTLRSNELNVPTGPK